MSRFEGPEDWAKWPPKEQQSEDRYDLGSHDGYGLPEMSLVAVDGGIRLTLSEGRDFVGKPSHRIWREESGPGCLTTLGEDTGRRRKHES